MGVSGSGKSTFGSLIAEKLNFKFLDADDFHSPENILKMSNKISLTDDDRSQWLEVLNKKLLEQQNLNINTILSCSALKEDYRKTILKGINVFKLIYLKGDYNLIEERIIKRQNHFFPLSLLKSQFEILEEPDNSLTLDIKKSISTNLKLSLDYINNKT